jgi:hypothetical protein
MSPAELATPPGSCQQKVRPILSGPTPVGKSKKRSAIEQVRTTALERFLVVAGQVQSRKADMMDTCTPRQRWVVQVSIVARATRALVHCLSMVRFMGGFPDFGRKETHPSSRLAGVVGPYHAIYCVGGMDTKAFFLLVEVSPPAMGRHHLHDGTIRGTLRLLAPSWVSQKELSGVR